MNTPIAPNRSLRSPLDRQGILTRSNKYVTGSSAGNSAPGSEEVVVGHHTPVASNGLPCGFTHPLAELGRAGTVIHLIITEKKNCWTLLYIRVSITRCYPNSWILLYHRISYYDFGGCYFRGTSILGPFPG